MKGCRTAARVKFCEGPCTCTHGNTAPMHLEGCPHNERRLSPALGRIPIYEEGALIFATSCENFDGNFEHEFSQKVRSGDTFIVYEKKKKLPDTSQALLISDLKGVVHSPIALQRPRPNLNNGTISSFIRFSLSSV